MKLPLWARALDAAAVIMAILALTIAIIGGFRINIVGVRLSVTDWWRPALWFAVAVISRHAVIRHPPLPLRLGHGIAAWWRHPDTRTVLPVHLATRFGVLVVGFLAVILIGFPSQATNRWTGHDD